MRKNPIREVCIWKNIFLSTKTNYINSLVDHEIRHGFFAGPLNRNFDVRYSATSLHQYRTAMASII
jgi:hypothetical protein